MDLVASCLIPEVEILLVVVAVDGGQPVGVALAGVHGVLPQILLLAAVLQKKQSESGNIQVSYKSWKHKSCNTDTMTSWCMFIYVIERVHNRTSLSK